MSHFRILQLLATAALSLPLVLHGDESLSALLEKTTAEYDLPAMGAIAFRSNALLDREVTGVRARGQNEKVTLEDKWHLGSLTKSMTATLAAMAVEQKKLSWSTSIQDSLGKDFKIAPAYQSVTLRDLLRHRGGFPSRFFREFSGYVLKFRFGVSQCDGGKTSTTTTDSCLDYRALGKSLM